MKEKIQELRNSGLGKLEKLVTTDQLSDWHRDFLGRKGELTLLLKQSVSYTHLTLPTISRV